MRSTQLQILVDLASYDQRLLFLRHDVKKCEQELLQKKHLYAQFQEHFQAMQHQFHQLKKDIDVQERYLQELQDKEDSLKIKMNNLHAAKEYTACIKEVENIEQIRSAQETIVLQMWEKFPEIEQKYQQDRIALQYSLDTLLPEMKALENQVENVKLELESTEQERKNKLSEEQGEWINLYMHMHTKVTNPIVLIVQKSCGGCFYPISPLDMQLLQHKKLLQCQNCYRILLYKD